MTKLDARITRFGVRCCLFVDAFVRTSRKAGVIKAFQLRDRMWVMACLFAG